MINDGQHRCAAIAKAIKENPALGEESISVLLFPYENLGRVQQMFSDLNRFVVKTSRSLDILFDQRDIMSKVTLEVMERVAAFQGMVDKDAVHSLPARSEKMFSLAALYDANDELLTDKRNGEKPLFDEMVGTAVEYWTAVSHVMPDWAKVKEGRVRPVELRQEKICTHAVVLRALGGLGAELMKSSPSAWKNRLTELGAIDWSKKNREWENVCMVANSVVSNRQARLATKAYLKGKLGLPLSDAEERTVTRVDDGGFATTGGGESRDYAWKERRATDRMTQTVMKTGSGDKLVLQFDRGPRREWTLPAKDSYPEIRRVRDEAVAFVKANGGTQGQEHAAIKALTSRGWHVTKQTMPEYA